MSDPIVALDNRVTRLEAQISTGFERLENLLRTEITDLKSEQIKDLREGNSRLADDQRRLWEHIGRLELGNGEQSGVRKGTSKAMDRAWNAFSLMIGGVLALVGSWLSIGRSH